MTALGGYQGTIHARKGRLSPEVSMAEREQQMNVKSALLSGVRTGGGRSPLLIVLGAVCICNLVAFTLFFDITRLLPHTTSSLPSSRLERHTTHTTHNGLHSSLAEDKVQGGQAAQTARNSRQAFSQPNSQHSKPCQQGSTAAHDHVYDNDGVQADTLPHITKDEQAQAVQDQKASSHSSSSDMVVSTATTQSQPEQLALQTGATGTGSQEQQITQHLQAATRKWRKHLDMLAGRVQQSNPVDLGPTRILPDPAVAANQTDWPIWWMAPFFDHTSFGKEAATLLLGLMRARIESQDIWVGTTQGDCKYGRDNSMPAADFDQLDAANHRWNASMSAIVVCHSLPPFWARPKNRWETCFPCPPIGYTPAVTIGRAMAETDIYHEEFVKYCNRMDEVWVPSSFSQKVLISSGVEASKVRVVPIPVNTTWFNPDAAAPIQLPMGELVFGQHRRPLPASYRKAEDNGADKKTATQQHQTMPAASPAAQGEEEDKGPGKKADVHWWSRQHNIVAAQAVQGDPEVQQDTMSMLRRHMHSVQQGSAQRTDSKKPVVLLSCFKWEMRKGWDILLAAYLQEFTAADNVELYILTKPFMAGGNFKGDMHDWVAKNLNMMKEDHQRMPTLYVISNHITDMEYLSLLKASDAYVIATRGEGWGMPISEAMSMGLPVVVTNWSGVADFVDESVGYMVDYKLSKVPNDQPWWFRGARWADATVDSLRQRLREVTLNSKEAAARGMRARQRMVAHYSPEALARTLTAEFRRLKDLLRSGRCGDKCHNKTWVAASGDRLPDLYTGKEEFILRGLETHTRTALKRAEGLSAMSLAGLADEAGRQRADAWKQIIANINPHTQTQGAFADHAQQ